MMIKHSRMIIMTANINPKDLMNRAKIRINV